MEGCNKGGICQERLSLGNEKNQRQPISNINSLNRQIKVLFDQAPGQNSEVVQPAGQNSETVHTCGQTKSSLRLGWEL